MPPLNFEKEAVNICKKIFSWDTTGTTAKIHIESALKRRHNATLRLAEKAVYKASDCGFLFSEEIRKLKVKS